MVQVFCIFLAKQGTYTIKVRNNVCKYVLWEFRPFFSRSRIFSLYTLLLKKCVQSRMQWKADHFELKVPSR